MLIFPGFNITRCDRATPARSRKTQRGGGVAILTREELRVVKLDLGGAAPEVESLWISATGAGRRTVIVGVFYRPPGESVSKGLEMIEEQFRTATTYNQPIIVLGDFNVNLLGIETLESRKLRNILDDLNLKQLVDQPTHMHPTPTLLDLIITNIDIPTLATVLPDPVADHLPVILAVEVRRQRRPRPPPLTIRPWSRVNWDALCLHLLTADWAPFYEVDTVDEKLEVFMALWDAAINIYCPLTTISRRRPYCPWIRDNPQVRSAMQERDASRRAWENLRTDDARLAYQRCRNNLKGILIRAKSQYLCNDLLTDKQRFWSRLKSFALKPQKGHATDDDDVTNKADAFNAHFASVGPRIAAEVSGGPNPNDGSQSGPRPPRVCASTLKLSPATLPELSLAIKRMNSSKAAGVDGIPLQAIKACFSVIGPHVLHIIDCCISTLVFPSNWKIARVTPVHKSGNRSDVNNYRPISILSVLSKIAEKVVSIQLVSYLLKNDILSPFQYAYRPCHSTEDAMLDAVEWISKSIDRGHVASLTTLDLSKAFDSVDHGVLLNKLEWYGIDSAWFRSYLCDRMQVVRGGSQTLPLTHGVAQGSIIGPVLFILFINDLSSFLPHGRLLSYADDTQLLDHDSPDAIGLSNLKVRVEESILNLQIWFRSNSLKMNPNKTFFTILGTNPSVKKTEGFQITLSGTSIYPSVTVKILGVLLDQHLTWEPHISMIVRRCNAILASLYKFRYHFTSDILKLLVKTHVYPHFLYCLSVWGGAAKCHLLRIQRSINFAVRLVTGLRRNDHTSPALESLGWSTIEQMVEKHDYSLVSRAFSNDQCPLALKSMFVERREVSQRLTRSVANGKLELARCRLSVTQTNFSYRAALQWNARITRLTGRHASHDANQ